MTGFQIISRISARDGRFGGTEFVWMFLNHCQTVAPLAGSQVGLWRCLLPTRFAARFKLRLDGSGSKRQALGEGSFLLFFPFANRVFLGHLFWAVGRYVGGPCILCVFPFAEV